MARLTERPEGLAQALRAPPMIAAIRRKLEGGRVYAISISPEVTGRYKRKFRIRTGVRNGKAWGRLINDARNPDNGFPYNVYLEFGLTYVDKRTGKVRRIKKYRVLGRTIDILKTI